jgi:hypothetical protein
VLPLEAEALLQSCPVVALRLRKIEDRGLRGKELRRAVKAARVY